MGIQPNYKVLIKDLIDVEVAREIIYVLDVMTLDVLEVVTHLTNMDAMNQS